MKPFGLEAVLKYRERLKDIARNRFQDAQNQHAQVKKIFDAKTEELETLVQLINTQQMQGIDITELIMLENRKEFLVEELSRIEKTLAQKQEVVVRERNHLLQKSKEQHVMEKLKEKQNAEWQQYLDKKEAAMLDEIAVLHRNK